MGEAVNLGDALGMDQPIDIAVSRVLKLALFNGLFLVAFQYLPHRVGLLLLARMGHVDVMKVASSTATDALATNALIAGLGFGLLAVSVFWSAHSVLSVVAALQRTARHSLAARRRRHRDLAAQYGFRDAADVPRVLFRDGRPSGGRINEGWDVK